MKIALIIPTYNAGEFFKKVLKSIEDQDLKPDVCLVVDSSSNDGTVGLARSYGCEVEVIDKKDFNHGLTRANAAMKFKEYDFVVFMTQDVIFADRSSLKNLIKSFDDENVCVAYGRQLTDASSSLLEKVSRKFNYPDISRTKTMADKDELGLNATFCSDSFAAYRMKDFIAFGAFQKTDFAEDMLFAARALMRGKSVAYVADARVYHSHAYNLKAEFKRGKAIGKLHKENKFLQDNFGKAEARGAKLFSSVAIYLRPILFLEALPKYLGYLVGKLF